jgi:hypothetical protein
MKQFFCFWGRCVRLAARGNTPHANDWQWVLASPLWQSSFGAAIGAAIGGALKSIWPDAPVIASDTWAGVFLGGLAGFVITWILAFLIRLVIVPVELFYSEKTRADNAHRKLDALDSDRDSTRDVGIGEAIGYICFREWGRNFLAATGSEHASAAKEYDELLQAFADGVVPAWGKRYNYGVHEPIPKEFWFNNRIDWFSLLRDDPRVERNSTSKGETYTSLMTSRADIERYWPAIGASGPRAMSALRISFGMEDPNTSSTTKNLYQVLRTLSVKLENIGQKALSGCKLIVESSDAKSGIKLPLVLREGITLAPEEHIFIPLVRYGEALDPKTYDCADSFATLATPDGNPLFDVGENIAINLKATGVDTPACNAQCNVWISSEGKLQVARKWPR